MAMYGKETNLQKLLEVLKDGEWHSNDELAFKVSWRFGDTIHKARKKGYPIKTEKVAHNQYKYRLLAI